jgi:hypothetical protein
MINHFKSILNKWNDTIEARLKDNESKNINYNDQGPRSEIEYW